MDTEMAVLSLTEEQAEYAMHLTGENYWKYIEEVARENDSVPSMRG